MSGEPEAEVPGQIRVARQPIYNRDLEVCGYELLYRQGDAEHAAFDDGDAASASVIEHALHSLSLAQLTGNHPAYINLTRRFFVEDLIPFHPDEVVLELLEHIEPDKDLLLALRRLASRGYRLALDDYILGQDERHWLIPYVSVIKVDVLNMSYQEVARHARWLKRHGGPELLAEKVETHQMLELCRKAGFSYFQGFFLSRPATLRGQSLSTDRVAILELLAELYNSEFDIARAERLINHDLSLSYKLLRYLRSPVFAARDIDSIRTAVLYLGQRELSHWALLLALASVEGQPAEQIRSLLIRAHVCRELTRHHYGGSNSDVAFTIGLFSGLDAVLDLAMDEICDQLPLEAEIREALIHRAGPYGCILAAAIAQEQADWSRLDEFSMPARQLNRFYLESVRRADEHYAALAQSAGRRQSNPGT
ncbi:MAG: EAL domain-containing protein [Halorhodospira halophila]|uniref:EAL and HDOD domain-containing protein n=1 Tax=Halorhodospira TaxID=85108 RepID=UPI001EE8A5DC|nr:MULTISPECIES: EAL domain-containing protein [Halorhodospira]MCC3750857.1 EAL domain-containing protein [Halorhodospira halophila]MCG5537350.1 EAL domain-containing protein [Halorhodospira sp. 9622]